MGVATREPRQETTAKFVSGARTLLDQHSCTPGEVSKLRGMLQFFASVAWSAVGKAAMGPVKQRLIAKIPRQRGGLVASGSQAWRLRL